MKCSYVCFITLNSCFINSDALHRNQITVKTYDICPLLQSPAQHTSQVSLCLNDVSSGLDCGVCEGTGIQRGAKFRPLTWLRTQGSWAEGPLEYQQTPQSSSRWHQSCLSEISPSNMDTGGQLLAPCKSSFGLWCQRCVWPPRCTEVCWRAFAGFSNDEWKELSPSKISQVSCPQQPHTDMCDMWPK